MEALHSFTYEGVRLYIDPSNPLVVSSTPNIQEKISVREVNHSHSLLSFLTIYLTQACNLSCKYCFGAHLKSKSMEIDTARAALDYLFSQGNHDVAIRFFGGEPTLRFEILQAMVEYATYKINAEENKRKIFFSIFTNAFNLKEEHIAFFRQHEFSVFISLDGPEKVHDRNRILKDGTGTFSQVFSNACWLVSELPHRVLIRAVIDPSLCDLVGVAETLFGTGADFVSLTLPWVSKDSPFVLNEKRLNSLKKAIDNLSRWYLYNIIRTRRFDRIGLHPFVKLITKAMVSCASLEVYACGAGVESAAVSTDGTLFPCHAFVGHSQFATGDVWGTSLNPEVQKQFRYYGADTVNSCKDCWAKYICTARCPADSYLFSGNIFHLNTLRCDFYRYIYEVSLGIYYILATMHPKEYRLVQRFVSKRSHVLGPY
jgi:uncharacterized protein